MLSKYYVAVVVKERTWFVSGCVRNLGHVALERSLNAKENLFEFFVAPMWTAAFESSLLELQSRGDVVSFCEKTNRFM